MAGSVNKVLLIGNLGKDPSSTTLNSGDKVVSFSLATSESWKDKNSGERREKTEWHNIVIYNTGLGEIVEKYCKKGSKVYLEGQLQTRKYNDKGGVEKYTTEIVLQRFRGEVTLLDGKSGGDGGGDRGGDDRGGNRDSGRSSSTSTRSERRPAAPSSSNDPDDDIPF